MKRNFYIACFTLLGALLGFLAHALFEILYIRLLVSDFDRYSLGFACRQLLLVHCVFALTLLAIGLVWGYKSGKHWWQILYVQQKYGKPKF